MLSRLLSASSRRWAVLARPADAAAGLPARCPERLGAADQPCWLVLAPARLPCAPLRPALPSLHCLSSGSCSLGQQTRQQVCPRAAPSGSVLQTSPAASCSHQPAFHALPCVLYYHPFTASTFLLAASLAVTFWRLLQPRPHLPVMRRRRCVQLKFCSLLDAATC